MKKIRIIFIFISILLVSVFYSGIIHSQTKTGAPSAALDSLGRPVMIYHVNPDYDFVYTKPKLFQFMSYGLDDMRIYARETFQKKNIRNISLMLFGTWVCVVYDQQILDGAKDFGKRINLSSENNLKTFLSIRGYPIFRGPTDLSSAVYFIGDGWTQTFILMGYLGYGMFKDDYRALQTASQVAEGLVSAGATTQLLKHITGRESPFVATMAGGRWRPFPNQIEYHKHVPEYDAYPSGHLATGIMTVTVIAENYPEYKFIRPLGYTLLTLLSYQMLNNGVHWFSDYPLSIAMGISYAKIALRKGRKVVYKNAAVKNARRGSILNLLSISPVKFRTAWGLSLKYDF